MLFVWSLVVLVQLIIVQDVFCFFVFENGVIEVNVQNNVFEMMVCFYFCCLYEVVEDFYWVEMCFCGNGCYWGVLFKVEDEVFECCEVCEIEEEVCECWVMWWCEKECLDNWNFNFEFDQVIIDECVFVGWKMFCDWMVDFDDVSFEEWFENFEYELVEYFVVFYDGFGQEIFCSLVCVM